MPIQNIIVHEVRKEEDQNEAEVLPRDEENEIDAHSEKLGSELSKLFKKTGLNTGQFTMPEHDDDARPHFVTLLERYFEDNQFIDFVGFSQAAAREFKKKLDDAATSKGGYLWFNHYTHNNEHFLSIVLLRKKNGLLLSNDLTLDKIEQLDLDKLHMAARINLSAWLEGNSTRFIAFRIGRGAKNVTDYFSKFIGCEEYTRARIDTQNLVRATKNYCATHDFDDVKTEEAKQFVFDQCIARLDDGEPVLLDNISDLLDAKYIPEENGQFLVIAQGEPFQLSNELQVERSALRGLTRYSGQTKKLTISFDSSLLNVSVFYDAENDEIKITELPQKLKDQLNKEANQAP